MADAESDRLKLMVVDDESDNLDLLYRTFRRDFDVFKADSGLKALQILDQQGEMAIIISDQRMPRMNGTEFLSRTVDRFPDTIRILLTGYTDVEDLVGAINAGRVFKYITKPWNSKELKTVVMQAVDTYRVVKQRTNELHRALRRESIFNAVTTAIRESLDYHSILQTVVRAIGQAFATDICLLRPVESVTHHSPSFCQLSAETFTHVTTPPAKPDLATSLPELDPVLLASLLRTCQTRVLPASEQSLYSQLIVPLAYQQEPLAVLVLHKQGDEEDTTTPIWQEEDIRLIEGVAEQAALAISQAKLYQRIQQQTEQMRAELTVARQIQ